MEQRLRWVSDRLKIHFPESPGPQGEQHRSYKTFDDSPPIIAMPVGGDGLPPAGIVVFNFSRKTPGRKFERTGGHRLMLTHSGSAIGCNIIDGYNVSGCGKLRYLIVTVARSRLHEKQCGLGAVFDVELVENIGRVSLHSRHADK